MLMKSIISLVEVPVVLPLSFFTSFQSTSVQVREEERPVRSIPPPMHERLGRGMLEWKTGCHVTRIPRSPFGSWLVSHDLWLICAVFLFVVAAGLLSTTPASWPVCAGHPGNTSVPQG